VIRSVRDRKREFLGNFITSALIGEGVIEAFQAIISELYYKHKKLSSELQKRVEKFN